MSPNTEKLDRLIGYLQHDPNNLRLLNDVVTTSLALADPRSRDFIDRLLALSDNGAEGRFHLAAWHLQQRQWEEAALLLQELLDEGLDNPGVRFNLAYAQAHRLQMQQAYDLLKPLVESQDASTPRARLLLARACHHLGLMDEARLQLHNQLEAHPSDAEAMGALALVISDEGDHSAARALAEKSLELAPSNYDARQALLYALMAEQDYQGAKVHVAPLLATKPDDGRVWLAKGMVQMAERDLVGGETTLARAVELMPQHLGTWNALGWSRLALGKLDEAEATFLQALSIDSTFSETHGGLACVYLMKGDLDNARTQIDLSRHLNADGFSAMFSDSLLSAIEGNQTLATAKLQHMMRTPVTKGGATLLQQITKLVQTQNKKSGNQS